MRRTCHSYQVVAAFRVSLFRYAGFWGSAASRRCPGDEEGATRHVPPSGMWLAWLSLFSSFALAS